MEDKARAPGSSVQAQPNLPAQSVFQESQESFLGLISDKQPRALASTAQGLKEPPATYLHYGNYGTPGGQSNGSNNGETTPGVAVPTAISADSHAQTSSTNTAVPSPSPVGSDDEKADDHEAVAQERESIESPRTSLGEEEDAFGTLEPIKAASEKPQRPGLLTTPSKRWLTEEELYRALSRRMSRTGTIPRQDSATLSREPTEQEHDEHDERAEIERLMSRMFGQSRQESSEEEKTRHVGVVFKNLTVTGQGLGAALQPTVGDIFLGLPRFLKNVFSKGPRQAAHKPPIRTIIDNFTGCIKPGEMLLVLGAPGAGCSTFLKVLGNQRFGYKDITGEVTYGGTDAETMGKRYRGEVS